ncbi:hypothetical protein SAMN02745975_03706 [Geosporobacter subterraneus DSM 17957]|uniref:Uncharacterized protein n=1 Tax=Geosporobacter subterraneus DSM 17957 TaxID=1121919 RepID=A0A1M6PXW8_9FIRM|nr:hypothetical protein [Geosporobacter subterraneus]SHK12706.1 hypothetical protein SAMN02745975_03706 [Geosporobacter subterraneus DSM 17957]
MKKYSKNENSTAKLYVEKGILKDYVQKNVLLINIEGYGRYQLYIDDDRKNNSKVE